VRDPTRAAELTPNPSSHDVVPRFTRSKRGYSRFVPRVRQLLAVLSAFCVFGTG
jgi:hypothetical protein